MPEVWQLQVGALLLPRVPEGSLEGAQEEVPQKTFRNSTCLAGSWLKLHVATDRLSVLEKMDTISFHYDLWYDSFKICWVEF